MEYQVKSTAITSIKTRCIVLPVFDDKKLSESTKLVDEATNQMLTSVLKRGDFDGAAKSSLLLPVLEHASIERVLLVGCGKKSKFNERSFRSFVQTAGKTLKSLNQANATFALSDLTIKGRDSAWLNREAVLQLSALCYTFNDYKSDAPKPGKWTKTFFLTSKKDQAVVTQAVNQATAIAEGMSLAKNLGNTPPNVCYPVYLSDLAKNLAKEYPSIKTKVLGEKEMIKLGMGSFMAVSKGSEREGQLIIMEYNGGNKSDAPHALVGKGITFDTGGISLKPGAAMDEMKYDMCGSASVFGTIKAIAEMELHINVVAVVAAAENMPDGGATRPGDIVTSMSGKTIEILNTDAEGRLVLCDALTYVGKYNPKSVIDIATLTGACIVALGKHISGLIANNDSIAKQLNDAGNQAFDQVWRLPMDEPYQEQLKSNFADIANIGGPAAGTITAGCFLSRFTEEYNWAHLDIAGTAWLSGEAKGATGRPVPLLCQYLINRSGA